MEEEKEDKNIFEIEFCFEDENCHDIDGEVLANYLSLLHCYCKEKKCNYSISPPERASYKQKANFIPQKGTRGGSVFTVDLIESFFEGTRFGTAENACKTLGKNVSSGLSTFFQSLSKNTKKVKSIILKEITDTKTKTKEIKEKEFCNYIIDDEQKEQEKVIMNVSLNRVEIASNGRVSLVEQDVKEIKKSTQYQNIVNNFSTKLVEANKQKIKEELPLYPDFDYDSNETK